MERLRHAYRRSNRAAADQIARGLIDVVAGLLGMVAVMIGTVGAAFAYMKVRGEGTPSKAKAPGTGGEFWQSARWQRAVQVATLALAPAGRNWRSLGYRLLGLRRVDARADAPVSIRSAVVEAIFDSVWQPATNSLSRPRLSREKERLTALRTQMEEIEREYAADEEARGKALMQFYRTNRVSPLPVWGWSVLPALLVQLLDLLFSTQGRTIRDRVTHTVVIVDP